MTKHFDILVVGGGPAGYSAAIHAARSGKERGLSVCLVEFSALGGTCLNRGCIPTKTLIETARLLDVFDEAKQRGIQWTGTASLDLGAAFRYKDRIVKRMSAGVGVLLRENGVVRANGVASVARSNDADYPFLVSVEGEGGQTETLLAKKLILATGSVPSKIPLPGLADPEIAPKVWDSDDILDPTSPPDEVPPTLAILGGGVIGIEMARIFKAFGSEVHLIEALPRLAPFLDVELSESLKKSLISQKINVSVGTKVQAIEKSESGLKLRFENGESVEASRLLVAIGRSPKIDMLSDDLRNELKPTSHGFLPVDENMKTSVAGLFAPGDVNGKCMLAHAAIEMGRLAAEAAVDELYPALDPKEEVSESVLEEYRRRIMEKPDDSPIPDSVREFFPFHVPGCIYGEPEAGYFGWTEEEARKKLGDNIRIGRFPFAANGRAASSGHREGFVKVIATKNGQQIVGVHIFGPCASELINEVSAVVHAGGTVDQWASAVHAHPTYGEALVEAAADALGVALHLPPAGA